MVRKDLICIVKFELFLEEMLRKPIQTNVPLISK